MKATLFIKSHVDAPDWEYTIEEVCCKLSAIEEFYNLLHGEYARTWIANNMEWEEDPELQEYLNSNAIEAQATGN